MFRVLQKGFAVLAALLVTTQGQMQPGVSGPCMTEFDNTLDPRCVRPTGTSFPGILFLVSDNATGGLPPGMTLEQFRQGLCQDRTQDVIIPCVQKMILGYATNDTRCNNQERAMIDQSGRQFLMAVEGSCAEPCERAAMPMTIQCFVNARIDPGRFLNSSITDNKFFMLGNTSDQARQFCSSANTLFTCLKQVRSTCPSVQEQLNILGLDIDSTEAAASLLCGKQDLYPTAQQCFARPTPAVAMCGQQTAAAVNQVAAGRFTTGDIPPSQFLATLCRVRLQQVMCELDAFAQSCQPQITALRTAFECSLLPAACRSVPGYQQSLGARCQQLSQTPSPQTTLPNVPPTNHGAGNQPPVVTGGNSVSTGSVATARPSGQATNVRNNGAEFTAVHSSTTILVFIVTFIFL